MGPARPMGHAPTGRGAHPHLGVPVAARLPVPPRALQLPGRLEPAHQNALRFYDDVAYDDTFNGLVFDVDEGDRLARCLAEKRVLFCGNHGVIVIGRTVAEAFDDLYFLERACQVQILAMSTGRPPRFARSRNTSPAWW